MLPPESKNWVVGLLHSSVVSEPLHLCLAITWISIETHTVHLVTGLFFLICLITHLIMLPPLFWLFVFYPSSSSGSLSSSPVGPHDARGGAVMVVGEADLRGLTQKACLVIDWVVIFNWLSKVAKKAQHKPAHRVSEGATENSSRDFHVVDCHGNGKQQLRLKTSFGNVFLSPSDWTKRIDSGRRDCSDTWSAHNNAGVTSC